MQFPRKLFAITRRFSNISPHQQSYHNWYKNLKIYNLLSDSIFVDRRQIMYHPEDTIQNIATVFDKEHIKSCLIIKNNQDTIIGIVSERDFLKALSYENIKETDSISKIMTPGDQIIYGRLSDTLIDTLKIMTEKHIRHLPVINKDDKIEGFISMRDITKKITKIQQYEIDELIKYIQR